MSVLGYFPGCSLKGSASDYDTSLRAVADRLGVELREVPEWGCCGASSAHALDPAAALCLAADTLLKAREAGMDEVLCPCAMCYQRLAVAVHEMTEKPAVTRRLERAFETPAHVGMEKVHALSIIRWLESLPAEQIKHQVKQPLGGMKIACYYGCMLVRPPQATGEADYEAPRGMERILGLLGAETVRWSMATECCGASLALSSSPSVVRQVNHIVDAAREAGANAVCVACPLCHLNLDARQQRSGERPALPVLYLTQVVAMAFGIEGREIGLDSHFVPVEPLLECMARTGQKAPSRSGEAMA